MKIALVCYECFDVTWHQDIHHRHFLSVQTGRRWWTCKECKEKMQGDA